ncbi:hypothetical protein TNCV_1558341 [Trichonephila clavipes]|uniref:Uncharacterized protein n=1 Tax=Trichonephila clavipes TaxID=2585209 RepID=A0A8X6R9Y0_TRICX|nr:hypothetical protein TNCV_1558341 [Trichonephila clavipes]
MSRSPPDRMLFGVQPLSGSTVAICGPVRQNHICVRVLCHRTASLCAMEIKLPSSGLLLIVLSLWRLIQLATGNIAYSAFNTLSLKFSPRTLLALFTDTTLANSWATYQAFDGITASGRHFRTTFYVIPSRLGVLDLVGGRVHLDDSELHRKGRSEMPFTCLKHLWF